MWGGKEGYGPALPPFSAGRAGDATRLSISLLVADLVSRIHRLINRSGVVCVCVRVYACV